MKPLSDTLKRWLKEKYNAGQCFCWCHQRLDQSQGVVLFAKTSKALARLNEMFKNGDTENSIK
ncbi:hypothetical protein MASR1M31_17630 [Porphyromonadaceae bacterium]